MFHPPPNRNHCEAMRFFRLGHAGADGESDAALDGLKWAQVNSIGFFLLSEVFLTHRTGDRLIPLASSFELSFVGFYMWAPLKV